MAGPLRTGQLVEITGSKESMDVPEAFRGADYAGPRDMNGHRGQLTELREAAPGQPATWTVATFGAEVVSVKPEYLRALGSEDVADFDLALGPASDSQCMGYELVDALSQKGVAVCKLFVAPKDLEAMGAAADKAKAAGHFSRLAPELEPQYLGKECTGLTMAVDLESQSAPAEIKESPLTVFEEAIQTVGVLISPYAGEGLGFDVYSRSNTMLSMPLQEGDDDEAPDCENEEAAKFLTMMYRAKLMVLLNAGPGVATLTLHPKREGEAAATHTVQPGMIAVFNTDRFKFSYTTEGKALLLSTFFLDQPNEFVVDDVSGDMTVITGSVTGPKPHADESRHVACVSMGVRYGFGVDQYWKLWQAYGKGGFDTMIRHPVMRWECDDYYMEDADQTSGMSYTCHGGFSDGIELFDNKFFDISPAEARSMDPTQRQVLEVSYIALQGAGFTKKRLQQKSSNVAAFVGLDKNEWNALPKDTSGGFSASSSANAITSNRFNYCMNLKGASMTIDTACSASLVCAHTAKLYLLHKHYDPCEAVITTGVNLSISPWTYVGACGAGMHSHVGRCFTYNSSADGYTRGESTASTAFKLHKFSREDGDLCLIAGSQVNQDGRSASLTAPNGPSQERCSEAVLREAGIRPSEVDTTECHGTGTSLGDPIEIGAYRKVMVKDKRADPVSITSSKSNIGHCEGSAGVSGLLKCVLMCMYGEGTPNVHLATLNPHLDMDGFPGVITTENVTFKAEASYNGVLSFGFGGTNACAQCWGVNRMTSRSHRGSDVYDLVVKKMQDVLAQDVTFSGDDWEDWEMDGPGRDARAGDSWEIEMDEDGGVSWSKKEKELPDLGNSYDLSGTFNNWDFDSMEPASDMPGLHHCTVEIGPSGQEEFQVVADQDSNMTFGPSMGKCRFKSAPVQGPGKSDREKVWVLRGKEGDRFRVEFYVAEAGTVSIAWTKQPPLPAAPALAESSEPAPA